MNWLANIKNFVAVLGDSMIFVGDTLKVLPFSWNRRGLFLKQCEFIGVQSLGVVTAAAVFLGGVLGYQLYVTFHLFGAEALLGGSVGVSLFRELAPTIAAIMVTGRSGAAIAAEIASMRISEQIDALEIMAIDPIEYLVVPRVLAGLVTMPLVAVYFGIVASAAGAGVSCGIMGLDWTVFWTQYAKYVDPLDLIHCTLKGATFGLILTWAGCFYGFRAHGGARAVGFATRTTVVVTFLAILLADYVLTSYLPFQWAQMKVH